MALFEKRPTLSTHFVKFPPKRALAITAYEVAFTYSRVWILRRSSLGERSVKDWSPA